MVRTDIGRADAILRQALSFADSSLDLDRRALLLFARAELAARGGEHELAGAVAQLRERLAIPAMDDEPEWRDAVRSLEEELGRESFRMSLERGAGRTEQELITAACGLLRGAHVGTATRDATLSEREKAVLRLVTDGKTSKQRGRDLAIAERTVKAHVTNILNKLGVMTRAQALAVAVRQGLI